MGDRRFEDRVKRIQRRAKQGAGPQLLAGVGDVREAQSTAEAASKPRASLLLALIGAVLGALACEVLHSHLGLEAFVTLPPDMLLEIMTTEPIIGTASAVLGICILLALISFVRGSRAAATMSFSWAALGGALAGAIVMMG